MVFVSCGGQRVRAQMAGRADADGALDAGYAGLTENYHELEATAERAIATHESERGAISQEVLDEADRLLDEAGLAASVAAEPSSPVDDPNRRCGSARAIRAGRGWGTAGRSRRPAVRPR